MAEARDSSVRDGPTIKGRLLLLVLVAALPVFLLMVWNELARGRELRAEAEAQALRTARLIAAEQEQFFETARTVLATYLAAPSVQEGDGAACSAYLARLLEPFPRYTGFGVARPDGTIFCSTSPRAIGANLAERDYFQEVMAARTFAVGDVMAGSLSGRWIVGAAYPLLDEAGEVRLVGVLGLDLVGWSVAIAAPYLPPGSTVLVLDPTGTIMARAPDAPDWLGRPAPAAVQDAERPDGAVHEILDEDGVRRLYGFVPLVPSEQIVIGVGLPVAPVFAEIDRLFWREIALIGAIFLLVGALAWIGGELTVRRPLERLQAAIGRIGAGDLAARSGTLTRVPEFRRLAASFDAMAATVQKRERELEEAAVRLELAVRAARMGVWDRPVESTTGHWNAQQYALCGVDPGRPPVMGEAFFTTIVHPDDREGIRRRMAEAFARDGEYAHEFRIVRPSDGEVRWLAGRAIVVGDGVREPRRAIGVNWDITERKRAEEELAAAFERQTLLLRELSHRVVNGFQIMASLLHWQRRAATDEGTRRALELAAERVHAMALVHRRLYRPESGIGTLDMADYLAGLCDDLREAFVTGATCQTLVLDAEPGARVSTDRAVTVGLLVTELVMNACKYAHPPDRPGRVEVRFARGADGTCRLTVGDDGVGLPADFDAAGARGLGMMVVRSQIRQLQGDLSIDRTPPGVRFTATFPDAAPPPPAGTSRAAA